MDGHLNVKLCSIFVGGVILHLPMKIEQTVCSKTSAHKIWTPGNHPNERLQHSEHGESFNSVVVIIYINLFTGILSISMPCLSCVLFTILGGALPWRL